MRIWTQLHTNIALSAFAALAGTVSASPATGPVVTADADGDTVEITLPRFRVSRSPPRPRTPRPTRTSARAATPARSSG